MGGARAGEVASQMACLGLLALDPESTGIRELRTAVMNANQAIVSRSMAEEHLMGMGTTLTAVVVGEGSLVLAHVGDSRAYLLHDGNLIQVTEDHSWVGEMVRRGELTPAQAAVHPHRSVITRALGTEETVAPDMRELSVCDGDRILLCSDGLTGMVSDVEIAEVLRRCETPQKTAGLLVKAALANGGEDNVTVVVVDVVGEDGECVQEGEDDQVGDGVIIGPTDRGALAEPSLHWGRGAAAAVRERLGRRAAPVLRPVSPRPGDRTLAADGSSGAGNSQDGGVSLSPDALDAGTPAEGREEADTRLAVSVAPAVDEDAAEASRQKRRRRKWIYSVAAVMIALGIAAGGFAIFNSSVYYVGTNGDGTIALYRGLPGSFLGIGLSSVVELAV